MVLKFDQVMKEKTEKELLEVLESQEDYQKAAVEAAKSEVECRGIVKKKIKLKKKGLLDTNRKDDALIAVRCEACKHEGIPIRWGARTGIGIAYVLIGGGLPGLVFFFSTYPYMCGKCGKRDGLVEIWNNKEEFVIENKRKEEFVTTSVVIIVLILVAFFVIANRP